MALEFCDRRLADPAKNSNATSEPQNWLSPINGTRIGMVTFITREKTSKRIVHEMVEIRVLRCRRGAVVGQIAQIGDSGLGNVTNVGQNRRLL